MPALIHLYRTQEGDLRLTDGEADMSPPHEWGYLKFIPRNDVNGGGESLHLHSNIFPAIKALMRVAEERQNRDVPADIVTTIRESGKDGDLDGIKVHVGDVSLELIPREKQTIVAGMLEVKTPTIVGENIALDPRAYRALRRIFRDLEGDASPTGLDPAAPVWNLLTATEAMLRAAGRPNSLAFPRERASYDRAAVAYREALSGIERALGLGKPSGSPHTADIGPGAPRSSFPVSPPTPPENRQSRVAWRAKSVNVIEALVGDSRVVIGAIDFDGTRALVWRGFFWVSRTIEGFSPSQGFATREAAEDWVENHWRAFLKRAGLRPI